MRHQPAPTAFQAAPSPTMPRALARLVRGARPTVDMDDRIRCAEPRLRALAEPHQAIDIRPSGRTGLVHGDAAEIDRAILQFAGLATGPGAGGPLVLRVRRVGARVWLTLAGTLPDRGAARRGGSAHDPADLPMLRRFAAAAHGRLHVRRAPGGGIVVSLNLPAVLHLSADEPPAARRRPSAPRSSTMKTDSQLQRDVMDELEWEPSIDHTDIGVAVIDGVVTLSGFVKSYSEKVAAEAATRRVAGVKAIAQDIAVRYPSSAKLPDPDLARRILDIFSWDAMIPEDKVSVKVEHGLVTLSGTVDWFYQREAARKAASKVAGVTGVVNLIAVKTLPVSSDVRDRIMAAFKRQADLDADAVTVVTDGGQVTLGGRVSAWHERAIAERAAWAAPGVTRVVDNIVVS